jgi:Ser/Thr protein kinase RdoA (MazF antagonist)
LDGKYFVELNDKQKTYLGYVYPFVPGRHVDKTDLTVQTGACWRAIGSELGRLHASWERHSAAVLSNGMSDVSEVLKGWQDEMAFFREWCQEDRVRVAWDHLEYALGKLSISKANYGFIHNDAHVWNMIFDPDAEPACSGGEPAFTLIDFDVANFHWFMCDCATVLYSFEILAGAGIEKPDGVLPAGFRESCRVLFWEGYRCHKDPGADFQAQLELFFQYRRCLLFMPMQSETATQPQWRKYWIESIEAHDRRLFV